MSDGLSRIFHTSKPIIGMLHLPALPGSAHHGGDMAAVTAHVLEDAKRLEAGGVAGLMIENFGDVPFYPGTVPAITIAHLTAIAQRVRQHTDLPLGINMLRNDGCSALAVAHAVGARFIRVNVLCSARVTDQGVIQGIAHDLLRQRAALGAKDLAILADVDVKHSAPLSPIPLEQEVADLVHRGGADALIVSGPGTGLAAAVEELEAVKAIAGDTPVLIGSGVSASNIDQYAAHADGFIVGSSLKVDGQPRQPIDENRVRELIEAANA